MKRYLRSLILVLVGLFATNVHADSDAARVLVGSALPPLPFNIIPNANFEDRTTGWSVSSGTFTTTSTTANVARGRFSASWIVPASTTSGLLFQTQEITIPAGLYGRSCLAGVLYKGSAATMGTMTIDAYDGTLAYGAKALIDSTTYIKGQTLVFTCPSSGTLRMRIKTTATTPASPTAVFFDEAFLADYDSIGGSGGGQFIVNTTATYGAAGTITAGSDVRSIIYVASSGGALTLDSTTPLSAGNSNGQERIIIGTSNTNTLTIPATGNVYMNGPVTLGLGDAITVLWDAVDSKWKETSRR